MFSSRFILAKLRAGGSSGEVEERLEALGVLVNGVVKGNEYIGVVKVNQCPQSSACVKSNDGYYALFIKDWGVLEGVGEVNAGEVTGGVVYRDWELRIRLCGQRLYTDDKFEAYGRLNGGEAFVCIADKANRRIIEASTIGEALDGGVSEDAARFIFRNLQSSSVHCRITDYLPLQITCSYGNIEFTLRRTSGKWELNVNGVVRFINDIHSNSFARIIERHGIPLDGLLNEVERLLNRRRPTQTTIIEFHPIHDYVPGLGPVLAVSYVDEAGRLNAARAHVTGGRLRLIDANAPIEVNDTVYAPSMEAQVSDLLPNAQLISALLEGVQDIPSLVREVAEALRRHVRLRDDYYYAVASWIVASYFHPIFRYFTVLRIGKPGFNAGGTTLLKIIGALSPRPLILVDPSDASMYRIPHALRTTMLIDEVKPDAGLDRLRRIALFIDAGFDRDYKVPRMDEGGRGAGLYSLYGPRVIVDPQGLITSYSNVRRQLLVTVTYSREVRELASIDAYRGMYLELIHRLYAGFLKHADTVYERYSRLKELYPNLTGDVLQAYGAVLTIASFDSEIQARVMNTVNESTNLSHLTRLESDPTKVILREALGALMEAYNLECSGEGQSIFEVNYVNGERVYRAYLYRLREEVRERLMAVEQVDEGYGSEEE